MRCTAFMTADKNVNRLESRKLTPAPGCDAGSYVLRRPGVLYRVRSPPVGSGCLTLSKLERDGFHTRLVEFAATTAC